MSALTTAPWTPELSWEEKKIPLTLSFQQKDARQ